MDEDLLETLSLLERRQKGDAEAEELLFRRFLPQVERFLSARMQGRHLDLAQTQDLAQEVVLKALPALDQFRYQGIGSFWAWLRAIALHALQDQGRRLSRRPVPEFLPEDSHAAPAMPARGPAQEAELADDLHAFDQALVVLNERERETVLLRIELGIEFASLAEHCQYPSADAARMAYNRAIQKLAEAMGREG